MCELHDITYIQWLLQCTACGNCSKDVSSYELLLYLMYAGQSTFFQVLLLTSTVQEHSLFLLPQEKQGMRTYNQCPKELTNYMEKEHTNTIQEHAFSQHNPTNTCLLLPSIVYSMESWQVTF